MKPLPGRLVLLGHPVAQSRSPLFQTAALRAAAIPIVYETLDVSPDALATVMEDLARCNGAGNVTIPHKEAIAERCVRRTPIAERAGAVNTFWHEDGALIGDNTDVGGIDLVTGALLGDDRAIARVALLGAGGAAAGVLAAIERWGDARVCIYNRHMSRADALANRFSTFASTATSVEAALDGATLVVNATPVGMHDGGFPVPIDMLPRDAAVFDLVYTSGETAWVQAARNAGHRAADGEGMLIEQGALAFERWFDIEPDRNAMWKAIH